MPRAAPPSRERSIPQCSIAATPTASRCATRSPRAAATRDAIAGLQRDTAGLLGYLEVHIEQGPVLEGEDLPVGVVTGITGSTRAEVALTGVAGHAGTVPMAARRDALTGAAEWIAAVESHARGVDGLVATIGEATVAPGASNVIPGRVGMTLDVRHLDDAARVAAVAALRERLHAIADARGLEATWSDVEDGGTVPCSEPLTRALEAAVAAAGVRVLRLPSGAGHDAAVIARLCDVAMLFVRCEGGISHNPAEAVTAADVTVAIDVAHRLVDGLATDRR